MTAFRVTYRTFARVLLLCIVLACFGNSAAADTLTTSLSAAPDSLKPVTKMVPKPAIHRVSLRNDSLQVIKHSDSLVAAVKTAATAKVQKFFVPDPQRALWLAIVLPGGGQIYNRKYWKLPLVYGGIVGCVYALRWNNQMYRDYSQAYLDIMDDDPNTKSYISMLPFGYNVTANTERLKTLFKNKKNYFRRYRDLSGFCIIGVYLLSVVDAYVDAELSVFDISRDLSLKMGPTVIPNANGRLNSSALGLRCQLNF